eukprot:scaffold6361_cov132-Isochrysis_galbana.AAC.10
MGRLSPAARTRLQWPRRLQRRGRVRACRPGQPRLPRGALLRRGRELPPRIAPGSTRGRSAGALRLRRRRRVRIWRL